MIQTSFLYFFFICKIELKSKMSSFKASVPNSFFLVCFFFFYIVLQIKLFSFKASVLFFFFKQKTAYEISECDWSSDVCSSGPRLYSSHIQKSRMPSSACDWNTDLDRKST